MRARAFCSLLNLPSSRSVLFFFVPLLLQCWQNCEVLENTEEHARTICEGDQYQHVSKFADEAKSVTVNSECTRVSGIREREKRMTDKGEGV